MRRSLRTALALVLCTLLGGCALSPLAKRTASFSATAAAAATDSANAYQVVEDRYYQAQVSALVISFDETGFDRTAIKPFMAPKDMQARTDILNGLQGYAELLAEVSGDQPMRDVDTQSKALSSSLKALSADDLNSWAPPGDIDLAVKALNVLAKVLMEHKRSRELPEILGQMREPIQTICELLQKDIGDPKNSGLRNQLSNSYADIIRKQQQYIRLNSKSMSPADKRAEIEKLPALVSAGAKADHILATTQRELGDLSKAHTMLADTAREKNSPAFNVRLQELVEDGRQLKVISSSLESR